MKKLILIVAVSFALLSARPASAQFPVLDFPAIAQTISQNITLVDQKINDIKKWKSLQQAIAIVGDIKKGLEKLADWKKEIDSFIKLFRTGLDLIDEALELIDQSIDLAESAKETLSEPAVWYEEATDIWDSASALVESSNEYAQRYKDATEKANAIRNNPNADANMLEEADNYVAQAQEYVKISDDYAVQAQELSRQIDELLNRMQYTYVKLENHNTESIHLQERACMLKVKGTQYKSELKRKFCKNPSPGVPIPGGYCDDEKSDSNSDSQKAAAACRTFNLVKSLEEELGVNVEDTLSSAQTTIERAKEDLAFDPLDEIEEEELDTEPKDYSNDPCGTQQQAYDELMAQKCNSKDMYSTLDSYQPMMDAKDDMNSAILASLNEFEQGYNAISAKITAEKQKIKDINAEIDELQASIDDRKLASAEVKATEDKIDDLKDSIAKINGVLKGYELEVEDLEKDFNDAQKEAENDFKDYRSDYEDEYKDMCDSHEDKQKEAKKTLDKCVSEYEKGEL